MVELIMVKHAKQGEKKTFKYRVRKTEQLSIVICRKFSRKYVGWKGREQSTVIAAL
jgi:hypothetical protein